MRVVLNSDHSAHQGQGEFHEGRFVPCFESPSRIENVVAALERNGFAEPTPARDFGIEPVLRVHDAAYVEFLRTVFDRWREAGREGDVIPYLWPVPGLNRVPHENLNAAIGFYAFSSDTPITGGTWTAAYGGAQTALSALDTVIAGERAAFALTRPPGHHAHAAIYGGYCYLNNVAICAEAARDRGYRRVCVLDVDFHHGNGTQDIFYDRADVLTISIHGDPATSFPYFLGRADETGAKEGSGANLNLPLPAGTDFGSWCSVLERGIRRISDFGCDLLVVALGVDTFRDDPISSFLLDTEDYVELGRRIAGVGLPTVIVLEGGYAVERMGENVVNVLSGFDAAAAGD